MPASHETPTGASKDGRDKRRSPRFTVESLQGTMIMASPVEILNLSLGGVAVRATRRFNLGCEYTLKLQSGDHALPLKGLVVWAVLSGSKRENGEVLPQYSAGLRFTDLMSQRLQELIGFIDHNKISEEHRLLGMRVEIRSSGVAIVDSPEEYRVKLISQCGMLIETEHTLAVESICTMSITPPAQPPIEFTGRVVSTQAVGHGRQSVGIEFRQMTDENHARLAQYLETLGAAT
jgi:hypothetical protein